MRTRETTENLKARNFLGAAKNEVLCQFQKSAETLYFVCTLKLLKSIVKGDNAQSGFNKLVHIN